MKARADGAGIEMKIADLIERLLHRVCRQRCAQFFSAPVKSLSNFI